MRIFLIGLLFIGILSNCSNGSDSSNQTLIDPIAVTPLINYSVVSFLSHDTALFTEGFLVHKGMLFESSGAPDDLPQTQSVVGISDPKTGLFETKVRIDKAKYFGEGIAIANNKLYQLTYKNQEGFVYDLESFKQISKFRYSNLEGWSLTFDGTHLIMSDGTDKLTYLDSTTLQAVRILNVTENGVALNHLNELEFIRGFVYANVWMTNYIVKIDPTNGKVVGKLDLSSLVYESKNKNPRVDVLNGIAYDAFADKIYVTGKLWPNIYEIVFHH